MPTVEIDSEEESNWAYDGKRFRSYRFTDTIECEIRALNRLDNWHGIAGYLGDLFTIAAAVALCIFGSWWFYPASLVVIGSRQRAFSNMLHESAHGMLAANRKLNLALGSFLTAYPVFQQHYAFKRTHVATHHPRLGDPERDPDLKFFIEQGVYDISSECQLWIRLVTLPALGSRIISHFSFLLKDRVLLNRRRKYEEAVEFNSHWRKRMQRDKICFTLFWLLIVGVAWMTHCLLGVVVFWVVPYMTTFQLIGWYIELSEHTPMVRLHNVDLYMTRNRKSRGLEKFLTGTYADHYHLDHHLDPRTPYWNLRKAHQFRMKDPEYALLDRSFGGLFTAGPDGQPSAVASIIRELAASNGRPTS
ncbi:fatty acid desaturase family protein [Streptomyces sp. PTM05]|uniref:Fatty acid desaturase family protein n=1 Tax=Streptantibioticus parmotrematis TaxID=2873249 RepID=A0ABS7R2K9_9ACTN|nr:fatty acid desaturase family protein [Streptantibioticus parmotrematis]MBY8889443.1 fatty acid desaturase family protein [Streptantibioticus parmotrematis]